MLHNKKNRRKVTKRSKGRKPVAGVAWYSFTQWQQLREVAADAERLENTYQEWLAVADQARKKIEASGIVLVKVPIDVSQLIEWCRNRNIPIDGEARAQYVVEVMKNGTPISTPNAEQ
jgi:23S rRNA A2030 N6-methylase RlmJ